MSIIVCPFSLTVAAPSYLYPTFTSTQHAKFPTGLEPSTTRKVQVCILVRTHEESLDHMSLMKADLGAERFSQ